MGDIRPSLDAPFRDFGVPATVTVPGGDPVAATVVFHGRPPELPPGGLAGGLARHDSVTRVVVRRAEVASLPTGTTIAIGARTWTVAYEDLPTTDDETVIAGVR